MICSGCLQTRRRSFFTVTGVCEHCDPLGTLPAVGPVVWPLSPVVALAAVWHDEAPWVTEGEARDRGTLSSAKQMLQALATDKVRADWLTFAAPAEAWNWLQQTAVKPEAECSDYECALGLLYRRGWVTPDTFALAASVYHAYTKSVRAAPARQKTPAEQPVAGFFYGTVGKRTDIPGCQCTEHRSLGVNEEHPEWGERFLIRFTAATGEELVWFASAGGKFDPQIGGTYNVRATVAKHEPYNGKASTIIQRPAEYDPLTGKLLHPPKRKGKEEHDE